MDSPSLYLIKSCVYVMAFYIPFILVLKRNTFFTINRLYLVLGLILSLLLPLCTGFTTISSYTPPELPFMEPLVSQTELVISQTTESADSINIAALLLILYLIGILLRLTILSRSIAGILKLKNQGELISHQNLEVFRTNTTVPFSFFHYVFLPKSLNDPGILEHEAAHVRQYHWMDLLIVETVSIILWFNPIIIYYRRSLKQQHEYLADQAAIKSGVDIREYLTSIKQQIEWALPTPLVSEFYFQSIKNRINMMTTKRTSFFGLATYTLVLPLIICLLMAFSPREHFQLIPSFENDSTQSPLSLCLPIDKKNKFFFQSGYGARIHPIFNVKRLHTGIDLVAKEGIPIVSTQAGIVVKAELDEAWGNIIIVQHDGEYATSYSHMKSLHVKVGDNVQKGQEIGLVGNTGISTNDHLHFELLKNGKAIDPIKYLPEIK